ncbi:hypothetical protein V7266_14695 [Neobacillus drentensis]|uniref:hypothetical protein n=1 Tax=Neobacillus drentensis TaxID=220684 RepID=UPI002FFF31BD
MYFHYKEPMHHLGMNQQPRNHHYFGEKSHSGESHHQVQHHHDYQHTNGGHYQHNHSFGSPSPIGDGGLFQNGGHGHHGYHGHPSHSGAGLGALGSLLGFGLSYLGAGGMKGTLPGSFGGDGGFPPPNPGPYGYGFGSAGSGFPGTVPAPYSGLSPASLTSYPQPFSSFSGGYGTWSPSEYGIPR